MIEGKPEATAKRNTNQPTGFILLSADNLYFLTNPSAPQKKSWGAMVLGLEQIGVVAEAESIDEAIDNIHTTIRRAAELDNTISDAISRALSNNPTLTLDEILEKINSEDTNKPLLKVLRDVIAAIPVVNGIKRISIATGTNELVLVSDPLLDSPLF